MQNKGISFADVLKNRPKSTTIQHQKPPPKLMELFLKFQRNPLGDYTLNFSGSNNHRNYGTNFSRNTLEGRKDVFDSWIQQQFGSGNNKQNSGVQYNKKVNMSMHPPIDPNRQAKCQQQPKIPTNIMANLKKQSSSALFSNQSMNIHENSSNFNTDLAQRPQSSIDTNKNNNSYEKWHKNHINNPHPSLNQAQNPNLKSQFQKITSQKVQQINNILSKDESLPQVPSQTPNLAQLIASTENIHVQIANMAKKIAQERKTPQIPHEDQLLLSERHESQNRRWEDAKNMVNCYFDKFKEKPSPKKSKPFPKTQEQSHPSPYHVGYSFAAMDHLTSQATPGQMRQNQMIQQISEIQSEQASQRISDSGNFDFVRPVQYPFGAKLRIQAGLSRQKVESLVQNLKQEFDGLKFNGNQNQI